MKWEYCVYKNMKEEELNQLGKEGWELLSVVIFYNTTFFYFKRPITSQTPPSQV